MPHDSPSARSITSRDALWIAIASALVVAFLHTLYIGLRVFVLHRYSFFSRDFVWMAPVSYGLFIVLPTVVLLVLASRWPRRVTPGGALVVGLWIAAFAASLIVRRLHPWSLLVLALGASIVVTRLVARAPSFWSRWSRRLALALLAVHAIGAVSVRTIPWIGERSALGGANPPADAPNVLFIILDTVRARNLGLYGHARANTPELETFGRSGVVFDWAFSPSSWTLPSHASFFTGRRTDSLNAGWLRSLDGSANTLAEFLASKGYVTGGFVANPHFTTWETGLAQGFHRWDDFGVSLKEIVYASTLAQTQLARVFIAPHTRKAQLTALKKFDLGVGPEPEYRRRRATEIVDNFLQWQERVGDRRFFGFINLFDAHDPYEIPPGWARRFTGGKEVDRYDESIAYMDQELGRLFDELARRGVLDRTIVIVSSDHGENFGEGGLVLHGNSLHLASIHVPLLIRWPGQVPLGLRVVEPVSLRRLPSTIADLAGLEDAQFPGQSLRETWSGERTEPAAALGLWLDRHPWTEEDKPAYHGPVTSVLDVRWQWIRDGRGKETLFEYRVDRNEERNLLEAPEGTDARRTLSALARELGRLQ